MANLAKKKIVKISRTISILALMLILLPLFSTMNKAYAQQSKMVMVTGTVLDNLGQPAVGATIYVSNTKTPIGTVADEKGYFEINVPVKSQLVVSFMSCKNEVRTITEPCSWYVELQEDDNFLSEVVVVGYGEQQRESLVGSISSVSASQITNTGTENILGALTGKVAGLQTTTTNGAPGEENTTLMLRGLSSWNGNSPVVLVDGVERSMAEINPNEVQSISVLKDASATAVFGSKGANGVILVTTKTGLIGRPKMSFNVEYGLKNPLYIPDHISSATTAQLANVALKNDGSFGSLYSDAVLQKYKDQSDPYRYPDVNWYDEIFRDFAQTSRANFSISGGNEKLTYYAMASYYHDGSILKDMNQYGKTNYSSDRINYRLNLDSKLTKTTELSFKLGGNMTISSSPSGVSTGQIFNTMYMATGGIYPAYFPSSIYEQYPDPNYPDVNENRIASSAGANFDNPMIYLMDPKFTETTTIKLNTDLILNQKLDFITKGLSARVHASLTSVYARESHEGSMTIPRWQIDWTRYDNGYADIWIPTTTDPINVYKEPPFQITQSTSPSGISFIFSLEGSLRYARSFGKHNVTALALYNQRQLNKGASSPKRNQSIVGRVTYNYRKTYLLEINAGITGSEQFAPGNRYGFFPSVAAGYVMSNEKFWKRTMPWWSTFKIRYSQGLVGSDAANANFLYYSEYQRVSYTDNKITNTHYLEGKAANENARWETAHKKDLGFEMGWFKNALRLNVDLYDEYRYDILMAPVVTPLIGVSFKDVNEGAIKKHGIDIELSYRKSTKSGFSYEVGTMLGLNENRIVKYADIPYNPQYQKIANTPYASQRKGSELVDDKYFQNINQIHGYPTYSTSWNTIVPGTYKFLDYYPDGKINDRDLHVLRGSAYPPCIYSVNLGFGYKGFNFRVVGTGTVGKKVEFKRAYTVPFMAGDLKVHKAQLDYWSPTNRNATAPVLSFNDQMYSWAGGTSSYPGYDLALDGYTWRDSDYFNISEMYLSYTFDGNNLHRILGVDAITVSFTCNNLCSFTELIEGNPQTTNTSTTYYPLMRTMILGLNVKF